MIDQVEDFSAVNLVKMQDYLFKMWTAQQNSLRHGHKLYVGDVQKLLQVT